MLKPSYRQPQMLRQANGGIRRECEACDGQAVDAPLRDFAGGDKSGERTTKNPVGALDGIADIGDRYRRSQYHVVVARRRRHQADPPRYVATTRGSWASAAA